MKALTIQNPPDWPCVDMVLDGTKKLENRSWTTTYRGPVALHRGGKGGAIVAVFDLLEILSPDEALERFPDQEDHALGPYCWVISNVRAIPEFPCKGKLGLWTAPHEIAAHAAQYLEK